MSITPEKGSGLGAKTEMVLEIQGLKKDIEHIKNKPYLELSKVAITIISVLIAGIIGLCIYLHSDISQDLDTNTNDIKILMRSEKWAELETRIAVVETVNKNDKNLINQKLK